MNVISTMFGTMPIGAEFWIPGTTTGMLIKRDADQAQEDTDEDYTGAYLAIDADRGVIMYVAPTLRNILRTITDGAAIDGNGVMTVDADALNAGVLLIDLIKEMK